MECRIDATVEDMGTTALCDMPDKEPITCDEFLARTEKAVAAAGQLFVTGSDFVERAVFDIIDVKKLSIGLCI